MGGGEGAAGKNSGTAAHQASANLANAAAGVDRDNPAGTEESKTDLRTAE